MLTTRPGWREKVSSAMEDTKFLDLVVLTLVCVALWVVGTTLAKHFDNNTFLLFVFWSGVIYQKYRPLR